MKPVRRFHVVDDEVGGWVPQRLTQAIHDTRRTFAEVARVTGFPVEQLHRWADPGSGQAPRWDEADLIGQVLGVRTVYFFAHRHMVADGEPITMEVPRPSSAAVLTVVQGSLA